MAADPGPQDPSTLLSNQQIEQALQQSRTPAAPTRGLHRFTQPEPAASVSLNIAFEYNSSDLKPQAYAQLTQLKLALSSAALGKDRIMVAGHTDAKGDPQYNQRLSLRRAEAVKHFLVANGLDARRLQAVGYGSDQPLTPDQPDDPRNRRVEIRDLGEMPP
jgi:outer membrane protein OmpA-like peptidoglycan-associated protein